MCAEVLRLTHKQSIRWTLDAVCESALSSHSLEDLWAPAWGRESLHWEVYCLETDIHTRSIQKFYFNFTRPLLASKPVIFPFQKWALLKYKKPQSKSHSYSQYKREPRGQYGCAPSGKHRGEWQIYCSCSFYLLMIDFFFKVLILEFFFLLECR